MSTSASGASNIPEFMPILSFGAHETPQQGACLMEMASFLAGEKWSDRPMCVNSDLALAARMANDGSSDEDRQRLLALLPRLMGTDAVDIGAGIDQAIRDAAAKHVEHLIGHRSNMVHDSAESAQHNAAMNRRHAISNAALAIEEAGEDFVPFIESLIDAYDKATGRTAPATVTEDDLRRCAELTGATA